MSWKRAIQNAFAFNRHKSGTPQDIRNFQDVRVRELVEHAYNNVPYYRRLFDANGIKPSMIRGVSDLEHVPITRKADLKNLPLSERIARGVNPRRLIVHSTGGSTGEPFTVCRTWTEERTAGLIRRRAVLDYGAGRGSLIVVASFYHKSKENDHAWLDRLSGSLAGARWRFVFAADQPSKVLESFAAMRPDIIGGYPGVLERIADHVLEHGLPMKPPACVMTGGEVLTANAREKIQKAFLSTAYDTYGAHEFSLLAWECPATGEYHRVDDSVITEVRTLRRPALRGEEGSLVGTALHSYAMPFIRYELGDAVTQGSEACACGAPFSTLLKIRGRELDYFVKKNGQLFHPYILSDALKPGAFRWLGKYRIVQESLTQVRLTAEARPKPTREDITATIDAARRVLGDDVHFIIDIVDELQHDPSGKYRIYQSKVSRN